MGTLALNALPRLAAPDSPPELVSPSSSSYSSRPSPPADLQSWASSSNGPVSPPMSTYERSSALTMPDHGKLTDDGQIRSDAAPARPRQQLPSLSSLFGPPASIRPLHSPISDRPSAYVATSPLDAPRVSPAYSERSYSTSYFPPSTSPSATHAPSRGSYSSRYDNDRPASLYPISSSFSGPESPRQRELEFHRRDSRHDNLAGARWTSSQDGNRMDTPLDSKDGPAGYRAAHDRFGFQFAAKDASLNYRDQMPPSTPSLMSTNPVGAHGGVSESVVATDALGPKIWTGTHFLPRFLRAAEVPGEGMCYFYDDGTHCKTVIDGEAVNAHWGVTKAGKPRKRLAIACMTCREKKIKCDPDFPRCVQCEKFGRVCKFKNAPRGGHNASPSTSPAEVGEGRRITGPPPHGSDVLRPSAESSTSVSPRTHVRLPSPEPPASHKRIRLGFDTHSSIIRPEAPVGSSQAYDRSKTDLSWQHRPLIELPRIHEDVLHRPWQSEPYVSRPLLS